MQTYGFRGEALASISMISRLTIQTKTRNELVAYKAQYENGVMLDEPKAVAGNQGTTIIIEDLFYNIPIRQKKSPTEEFGKIFEVVSKYAVHNHSVSFTLKKHGENNSIRTQASPSPVEVIRTIYGNEVANSLLKVTAESEDLKFKMSGFISKADYSGKKGQFLLFINHRLVESKALKKALFEDLYRALLTNSIQPFIYMSIELDPGNVDVNVSPTKNEVTFLNEDMIINEIKKAVEGILLQTNETRKVFVQQLLPGAAQSAAADTSLNKSKPYAKDMIRTDASTQSIVKFLSAESSESPNSSQILSTSFSSKSLKVVESTRLTSVKELLKEIDDNCDEDLKNQIRKLKYVGNADRSKSLIQCENILYICNNRNLAKELFYQESLRKFENYDALAFESALKIQEIARIGFDLKECAWTEDDGSKDELAVQVEKILTGQQEMLKEYFQISINSNGELETLPIIVENYSPLLAHLPMFFIRLATEVNFEDEKECFRGICQELACLYSKWSLASDDKSYNYLIEHIVIPKIQKCLIPPTKFANDGTFLKLTSLQELYKVFERC